MTVLPPFQWSAYVATNPDMGKPSDGDTHAGPYDLRLVNEEVNDRISPAPGMPPSATTPWEPWRNPGWCGDYAVTKREMLLRLGWASRFVRIAEVVTVFGEEHAVLVADVNGSEFVLDNRTAELRAPSRTGYKWVRIQSHEDPNVWEACNA